MRKVYFILDYEGEIVAVLSDKFYHNKVDVIDAVQELSESSNSRYWTWTDVEEHNLYDTLNSAVKWDKNESG